MKMRIVPVLDLKNGVAVHAVRGERTAYRPVRSVLVPSADPLAIARAFKSRLGFTECYVADLDAIERSGEHGALVGAIGKAGLAVWLDAGVSTAADARQARAHGASRVILGTETLRDPNDLPAIVEALREPGARGGARAVLSLDLRQGRLLGGSPGVEALDPLELAQTAWKLGIRTFIVLDLARVGSGGGVEMGAALRVRQALPDAEVVVGGGVRHIEDLRALADLNFDATLVATALHAGIITASSLAAFG